MGNLSGSPQTIGAGIGLFTTVIGFFLWILWNGLGGAS